MGKQAKLYKKYTVKDGKLIKTVVFCSRCGDGYIMAEHEDRYYCGNCHFTKFKTVEKKS